MIRVIITQLILFLLPFLIYWAYLFFTRKLNKRAWIDAPRYWLVVAGLVTSLVGLGIMSVINNNPTGGTYVPAHYEDGVLIPGTIVKKDAEGAKTGSKAKGTEKPAPVKSE
ncbi:MAG: DUF6111 family protein [Cohaesibacter sp.]|jgi:heme A synthase|nr:DUF6111 family protein [Cohaesibacter sp.]